MRMSVGYIAFLAVVHFMAVVVVAAVHYCFAGRISISTLHVLEVLAIVLCIVAFFFLRRAIFGRPHRYGRDVTP